MIYALTDGEGRVCRGEGGGERERERERERETDIPVTAIGKPHLLHSCVVPSLMATRPVLQDLRFHFLGSNVFGTIYIIDCFLLLLSHQMQAGFLHYQQEKLEQLY